MKRTLAALGMVAILAAAGCDTGIYHGFGVQNRSSQTVDIEYTAPTGEKYIIHHDLLALSGSTLIGPESRVGECNEGTLRALDASGRLVAETSERLCDGDRWIIPADPSPS